MPLLGSSRRSTWAEESRGESCTGVCCGSRADGACAACAGGDGGSVRGAARLEAGVAAAAALFEPTLVGVATGVVAVRDGAPSGIAAHGVTPPAVFTAAAKLAAGLLAAAGVRAPPVAADRTADCSLVSAALV